jgi:two-component system chemotaxis response regulator CheB
VKTALSNIVMSLRAGFSTLVSGSHHRKDEKPLKCFPIICLGGAASEIDSYTGLLGCLPADLGVSVVIIHNLSIVIDMLIEVLPRFTTMPVILVTEDLTIEPNRVFVIPAERDLHVAGGKFHLKPTSKPKGWPDVITVFLRSLTENWPGQIIAVILSGYDGDGAAALRGVKAAGGITFAQQTETADQADMPLNAIATGCVDYILPVEGIAKEIARITNP